MPAARPSGTRRAPSSARLIDLGWIDRRIEELDTHLARIDRRQPGQAKRAADTTHPKRDVARWPIAWDARLREVRAGERASLLRRRARLPGCEGRGRG